MRIWLAGLAFWAAAIVAVGLGAHWGWIVAAQFVTLAGLFSAGFRH